MTIPNSVKIGLLTYSIEEDEDIRRKDDNAYLFGHVSHEDQTIDIRASLSPALKSVALLHEIIHALFFHTGHFFDDTDEERICVALSHGIVELLRNNPDLTQYLCEDEERPITTHPCLLEQGCVGIKNVE